MKIRIVVFFSMVVFLGGIILGCSNSKTGLGQKTVEGDWVLVSVRDEKGTNYGSGDSLAKAEFTNDGKMILYKDNKVSSTAEYTILDNNQLETTIENGDTINWQYEIEGNRLFMLRQDDQITWYMVNQGALNE